MDIIKIITENDNILFAAKLANDNQGVLSIIIFAITVSIGWSSGIFTALRRKPKFRIKLIPGPNYYCTFPIGETRDGFDVHRTGIALYLQVSNIGSAPSSIESISIAYHWNIIPYRPTLRVNPLWIKYGIGWFWLNSQSAIMADFQAAIGENLKIYPFLFQKSIISGNSAETFLEVGRSTSGVVYFEQGDSWGACYPKIRNRHSIMKIRLTDVFGRSHHAKFRVPWASLEEARKYNPAFGKTLAELRQAPLPCDRPQNQSSDN